MSFITPQFAAPLPVGWRPRPGEWVAEQKYDGHRIVVEVSTPLFEGRSINQRAHANVVHAWSRNGACRTLPSHVYTALARLPVGIYDGELCVPGGRSYGVTELVQQDKLVYVVFDLLRSGTQDPTHLPYDDRRRLLEFTFHHPTFADLGPAVILAPNTEVNSLKDMHALRDGVWLTDGEGLILKRRASRYHPGRRPKDWLKVKQLHSAVFTVIGFEKSKGQINDRGPFAKVLLRDDAGHVTSVKTLNDVELAKFMKEDPYKGATLGVISVAHPAIGRKLRCEYQERTPDDLYRHIRWDRWEDE